MLTYLTWFLAGALAHRISSFVLSIWYEKLIIEKTLIISAGIIKAIENDATNAVLFKHKSIIISDMDREVLERVISSDYKFLSEWKESVFLNIMGTLPPKYIKSLPPFLFDRRSKIDKMLEQLEEKVKK